MCLDFFWKPMAFTIYPWLSGGFFVKTRLFCQEMKNAYLIQMRRKEEKMMRAREDEASWIVWVDRKHLPGWGPRSMTREPLPQISVAKNGRYSELAIGSYFMVYQPTYTNLHIGGGGPSCMERGILSIDPDESNVLNIKLSRWSSHLMVNIFRKDMGASIVMGNRQ